MGYKAQLLSVYLGTHTNYNAISLTGSRRAAAWSSFNTEKQKYFLHGKYSNSIWNSLV